MDKFTPTNLVFPLRDLDLCQPLRQTSRGLRRDLLGVLARAPLGLVSRNNLAPLEELATPHTARLLTGYCLAQTYGLQWATLAKCLCTICAVLIIGKPQIGIKFTARNGIDSGLRYLFREA